jgi:hypothetical protein
MFSNFRLYEIQKLSRNLKDDPMISSMQIMTNDVGYLSSLA